MAFNNNTALDRPDVHKYKTRRINSISSEVNITFALENALLDFIWLEFTSDANAGNRLIQFSITDPSFNIIERITAGAVQAASIVNNYNLQYGQSKETIFSNNSITLPIPERVAIPVGYFITLGDSNSISAADSLAIGVGYRVLGPDV